MKEHEAAKSPSPKGLKTARVRVIVIFGILAVAAVGYFTTFGIGNLCAIGWGDIALLCPLGALLTMVAQKTLIPQAVISLVFAAVALVLLGRFFCSWICPVAGFKGLGIGRRKDKKAEGGQLAAGEGCKPSACASCTSTACGKSKGMKFDSRHAVLGAAVASTAIFGFPVFCLVCPVGLTFASVLLVMRLFAFGEVTWAILVLPAIIIAEIVLFPKWCQRICPLGALTSLVSGSNKTFRPVVDAQKCLKQSKGVECDACLRACEEGINLHDVAAGETTLNDCTKCRDCADVCPVGAISFPFLSAKDGSAPSDEAKGAAVTLAEPSTDTAELSVQEAR